MAFHVSFMARKFVNQKHFLIMQIALKPGQIVPEHKINSNVHLLVLKDNIVVMLNNISTKLKKGDLLAVEYQTLMSVKSLDNENATFLVLKAHSPSEMNN